MFATRLFSGIVVLLLAIAIIHFGSFTLWIASLGLATIAMYELYKAFKLSDNKLSYVSYILVLIYYMLILLDSEVYTSLFIIISMFSLLALYVLTFPKYHINDISRIIFVIFYIGILFSYIYKIRKLDNGSFLVWLVFISSWGSDVCAYAVGMLIGKHKIAPKLSPNKSLEGCIGGVLGATIMGYIFGYIFSYYVDPNPHTDIICGVACTLGSIISQIGDFTASAIKRNQDIKDYGDVIPGHGGILDRIDSILFTAPTVFFVLVFLSQRGGI